jgi:hypothetical protein
MSAETMVALADRCEAASGPDRELDAKIARETGAVNPRTARAGFGFGYVDRGQWACSFVPAYTASLDAAMTLVPEGCSFDLVNRLGCTTVRIFNRDGPLTDCRRAITPALALCAAALKARSSHD